MRIAVSAVGKAELAGGSGRQGRCRVRSIPTIGDIAKPHEHSPAPGAAAKIYFPLFGADSRALCQIERGFIPPLVVLCCSPISSE